ncbi:hypothetical protein [Chitinophaga sp. 22620]|uniref:hypothetical protein n=1 Tax=Chitinophaga sp. 22620 TaxID=3453952 RepID=UPI003F84AD59
MITTAIALVCCCLAGPLNPQVTGGEKVLPILKNILPDYQASSPQPGPPLRKEPIIKVVFVSENRPEDPSSDTLFYHQRHIIPGDFLGRSSASGKSEAVSFTSFAFDGSTRQYRDTLEIRLVLQVFWVKSSSWSRSMPPSRHVLEHEQLHFDITRLVSERFRRKVLAMPLTIDDHDSRIQYEYLESFREMNRMQEDYDNAVYGPNTSSQQVWAQRIRNGLKELGVEPPMLPPTY